MFFIEYILLLLLKIISIMRGNVSMLFLLIVCFLSFNLVNAQITIGSSEPANAGALLDLKENKILNKESNSNKGLGMPRVALIDLKELIPMFSVGYNKAEQDHLHIGMIVYNVTEDIAKKLTAGLYVWNGETWSPLNAVDVRISASRNNVLIDVNTETVDVEIRPRTSNLKITSTGVDASSTYAITKITDGKYRVTFTRGSLEGGVKDYKLFLEDNECVFTMVTVNTIAKPRLDIGKGLILIGENEEFDAPYVHAIGGSEDWEIVGFSPMGGEVVWGSSTPKKNGKNLFFNTGVLPGTDKTKIFKGWIDVRHKDDVTNVKRIEVHQSKSYTFIPKSDYMIIRFQAMDKGSAGYNDIDGVARILNTGIQLLNGRMVGYFNSLYLDPFSKIIYYPKGKNDIKAMEYGGDNRTGGFESILVYTKNLNEEILSDREVKEYFVDLYCTWWIGSQDNFYGQNVNLEIDLYVGGEISINSEKVFINTGGVKVGKTIKKSRKVPNKGDAVGGEPGGVIGNYTPLGRIVFNRETDTVLFLDVIP